MLDVLNQMVQSSGLAHLTVNNLIMICLACFFLYLGIKRNMSLTLWYQSPLGFYSLICLWRD